MVRVRPAALSLTLAFTLVVGQEEELGPLAACEALEDSDDGEDEKCYEALFRDQKYDCKVRSSAGVQLAFASGFKKKTKLLREATELCPNVLFPRLELAKVRMPRPQTMPAPLSDPVILWHPGIDEKAGD